ncbi:AIM24 family protein [Georgenia faecalis]|uniref:AIM24 family protein n=1 Tax=Georgenia faecalis TaxID=2483799 RepID=A0ABV9D9N3_9MICO|nr:AIM24 family protein [Georgenia faecalis]
MAIHGSLFHDFRENVSTDPFSLQNKKLLKIQMGHGPVWAKSGSMVAYQGDVRFQNRGSGGLNKMLKSAVTGEGVDIMECTGVGELFVAVDAAEIQIMYLENDLISVNGANVLAFSASIEWDIHRIKARGAAMTGGLYNVSLRGTGYVAVTTKGEPVALDVASAPTFADAQAVVLWTSGVTMDIRVDTGGLRSMVRGGTGEMLQMAFGGQGYVLVQPSESVVSGGHQEASGRSSRGSGGIGIGSILGD